jgi:hypothetical protein
MREQANRSAGVWFAEYSGAAKVLQACVEEDPRAVWKALLPHLTSRADAYMFSIGFPRGVIERISVEDVMTWIDESPDERGTIVAKLASMDFASDVTLAARVLGVYGDREGVATAFFGEYVSGVWSGSASAHWIELAGRAAGVATSTGLPKLRRWATQAAHSLHEMAERDRGREEERDLRP